MQITNVIMIIIMSDLKTSKGSSKRVGTNGISKYCLNKYLLTAGKGAYRNNPKFWNNTNKKITTNLVPN